MIRVKKLRQMLQAHVGQYGDIEGRERFVEGVHDLLGIGRNEDDQPTLAPNRALPKEFSLRYLAEAIGGHEWVEEYFDPSEGPSIRRLLEAGPGVDPTSFLNINTFNLAVAGLVEAKIIEHFQNASFIGDRMVETMPSKKNGEKFIGTTLIGDKAQNRRPGESHTRVGFGEQWVTTPETVEKALAVEVQQEAVFFDLTGQVLDTAGTLGDELGYRREKDIISGVVGGTNTYTYKGNSYNTYLAAADSGPWVNKISNPFTDWTSIDAARLIFTQMTDPATGKEILINPSLCLIPQALEGLFSHTLQQTYYEERTDRGTDVGVRVTGGSSPLRRIMPNLDYVASPIQYNVVQASAANGGLALSAANAKIRWWIGDFKRAFKWIENWPLRVRQASPTEYVMLDRGIIAAYFANYRGVFGVREPRYVVECTE